MSKLMVNRPKRLYFPFYPFCDDCEAFDPELQDKREVYSDGCGGEFVVGDIIVKCEHSKACLRMHDKSLDEEDKDQNEY